MSSNSLFEEKHWKAIWKIKAPGKLLVHIRIVFRTVCKCTTVIFLLVMRAFSAELRKVFNIDASLFVC
jgi:hypothetical protein